MDNRDDSDVPLLTDEESGPDNASRPNNVIHCEKDVSVPNGIHGTVLQKDLGAQSDNEDSNRCRFWKSLTIEPLMAMFMISYIARTVCNQNMLIDKSCLYVFNLSHNICSNLQNHTEEKKQVVTYSDNYYLYISLLQTLPAVFFSMVIGPWSDKYGRKLPIILSITGGILENVGVILNVIYFDAPLYFLLISVIPAGIMGGMVTMIQCIYSLASDQTTQKQRTIKYAFLELAFGVGLPIGTSLGGFLFKKYGYLSVYILSMSFQVVCILWMIFVVKETRVAKKNLTWEAISDLFCFDNFKESFHTISKPREKGLRAEILLLVASMCTLVCTLFATNSFGFYFAQWMYNFDTTFYSYVSTIFMACGMVLTIIVVLFSSRVLKLKNSDVIYGIVGSISVLSSNIIKSFATKTWIYYLGCTCGALGALALLSVRSRISKIVKGEELGKVFAFLASCETLTPVLASVAFTQIFNASMDFYPGLAYLVAGILVTLPVVTYTWIARRNTGVLQQLPNKPEIISGRKE